MNDEQKKILVVDDDPDIAEAIRLILSTQNFDAEAITEGEETCQKVLTYKPNLIILDILLSGCDGREVCRLLKENKQTKQIPVIMMSAHPRVKQSIEECKADSFVAKPFSMTELLSEVKKYLNNSN